MVFAGGLHKKVLSGRKSEVRLPAEESVCPYKIGRDYGVQEGWAKPSVARIRVIAVSSQRLGDIGLDSIKREGFKTRSEFEEHWAELYGDWDPNLPVWAIVFMLTESPLLLARDSTRGYTHDPRLALPQEPEAVNPEEVATLATSKAARARYEEQHAEDRKRAELRSLTGRLRESAIRRIKEGGDPTPVLQNALMELEQ